jgi:hypothetical protein
MDKPVARTLPIAGKPYFAFATVTRERIALRLAKGALHIRRGQFQEVLFLNIPQQEPGLDKMIARVEIAIVL